MEKMLETMRALGEPNRLRTFLALTRLEKRCLCENPELPWLSPLYGKLEGLPPLLIHVGGNEVFYDDAVAFAKKARESGVETTLRIDEGLFHCYPVCSPLFPEAKQAMEEICEFLKRSIASERA